MSNGANPSPLLRDALEFAKANWWMFLLGGVLYILFGVLALARPAQALLALAVVFAAFLLVDGVFSVVRALGAKGADGRWWVFFGGLLSSRHPRQRHPAQPAVAGRGNHRAAAGRARGVQRITFSASGLMTCVGLLFTKLTTLSKAALKYSS